MKTKRSRIQQLMHFVCSDDVYTVEHLIYEIYVLYVQTGEMEAHEFPNLLLDVVYEAATANAEDVIDLMLIKKRFSKGNDWRMLWSTTFLQVCHKTNYDAAMLLFEVLALYGDWGTSVAKEVEVASLMLPKEERDFYAHLVYLHNKAATAKKVLELRRLRGCFRCWALNEELLAPAYQPPTAEVAGGAAFQREEVAALVVLA